MLTKRQKQILNFINDYIKGHDYAPSLEEIRKHFRLRSVSTVHGHIETLRVKGYLKKSENQPRGIEPYARRAETAEIPLLGYIAAGEPIEPLENPEPIAVPKTMVSSPGQHFALKIQGDSMIEDGILDKDVIVVKHQLTANDRDTVVAVTEKGATLKILRKRGNKVHLEPRNKRLENIYPKELEIRGKFVGLLRQ